MNSRLLVLSLPLWRIENITARFNIIIFLFVVLCCWVGISSGSYYKCRVSRFLWLNLFMPHKSPHHIYKAKQKKIWNYSLLLLLCCYILFLLHKLATINHHHQHSIKIIFKEDYMFLYRVTKIVTVYIQAYWRFDISNIIPTPTTPL